ncbi:serine--tRNA ligase [Patescibacteria group bacterium]|nr:serine--tRNA ligase [Patescibacteria group bacterium]MBU4057668.1 serine--tRNA ligase [Patescibacteria group bacterium]MBU4115534.1 serine--tRNA ligase [Patescibacteria group bacterium]
MLDIKFIRENKDLIKKAAKKKSIKIDIDELIDFDERRKTLIVSVDKKRNEQNEVTKKISVAKDQNERNFLIADMQKLKIAIQKEESELREVIKAWQMIMLRVPNIPDMSVPDGKSEEDNKEIKKWGDIPEFGFNPKNHVEIMKNLDMVDFERGAKVSGFRGYFMKNEGALLNFALWQYTMDRFVTKKGFTPMIVPSLVGKESFIGTGYLPDGEEDLYKTQDDNFLSGTAEIPTMGYYMNETVNKKSLPIKFMSFSPCFRREAGSHGKDTKGLFRVHEFFKLEQVILCEASHEESVKYHEELLKNAEEIMQDLDVPYRIVVCSSGDLGLGQVKKYDIEAWIPSENTYRETHSCSYFHDFQTRRLNIKYKDSDGKFKYVHSLNSTAITARALISVVENGQQKDGSIIIPDVLAKYIGKKVIKKL